MTYTKRRVLALDFDGVIVDSIKECYVSGYNAFQDYMNMPNKIYKSSQISQDNFKQFELLREYVNFGQDYVFIFEIIKSGAHINHQIDFDDFIQDHEHLSSKFDELFYQERLILFNLHYPLWIELNPFYDGLQNLLKNPPKGVSVYIISTKRSEFIDAILKENNILAYDEHIYASNEEYTKVMIVKELLKIASVKPRDFYFVDDQIKNVTQVAQTQVNSILALWGYNGNTQRLDAITQGLLPMSLEDFHELFQPN